MKALAADDKDTSSSFSSYGADLMTNYIAPRDTPLRKLEIMLHRDIVPRIAFADIDSFIATKIRKRLF